MIPHNAQQGQTGVTILLATYNGERFLREQLASLAAQTHRAWELWARDDGSTDRTRDVLGQAARNDTRIHVLEGDTRRLGSTQNFGALLDRMRSAGRSSAYVMFCDQDDVWRPEKIAVTLAAMQRTEAETGPGIPVLVHTDFDFVDDDLTPRGSLARIARRLSSPEERVLNRLLSQNFIYGCTMMLNRSLLEASVPVPEAAEQHDYWVALVASALGRVVHVEQRTVQYRQHESNETPGLGAASISRRARRLLFGWREEARLNRQRYAQAHALATRLEFRLSRDKQQLLAGYLSSMSRGRVAALRFALRNGLRRQGPLQTGRYLASLLVPASDPGPSGPSHIRSTP
jgi:glycosyltransferase involved in cell wall biosynthesis